MEGSKCEIKMKRACELKYEKIYQSLFWQMSSLTRKTHVLQESVVKVHTGFQIDDDDQLGD